MDTFYYSERTFAEAVKSCAVRESVYQVSNPGTVYAKNHDIPLSIRVPKVMQSCNDWRIYDPQEQVPQDRTRRFIGDGYFVHHVTREEIDHKATGAHLRRERIAEGITLREQARRLDISAAYLSELERGKKNWNREKVCVYMEKIKR